MTRVFRGERDQDGSVAVSTWTASSSPGRRSGQEHVSLSPEPWPATRAGMRDTGGSRLGQLAIAMLRGCPWPRSAGSIMAGAPRLVGAVLLCAVAACGDTAPEPLDLSGRWSGAAEDGTAVTLNLTHDLSTDRLSGTWTVAFGGVSLTGHDGRPPIEWLGHLGAALRGRTVVVQLHRRGRGRGNVNPRDLEGCRRKDRTRGTQERVNRGPDA